MSPGLPDDVRQLLQTSISSARQLDMLLLLREAGESRTWSAGELEAELRSSPAAVDADLAGLLQAKLVEVVLGPPTLWRYSPGGQRTTIDSLAACYRTHRTAIVRCIGAATSSGGSLDQFADAFRFRRKEDDDG